MAKYFYKDNKSSVDGTNEIILESDEDGNVIRSLSVGGGAEDLTDDQYESLKDRYVLETEGESNEEPVVETVAPGPSFGSLLGGNENNEEVK